MTGKRVLLTTSAAPAQTPFSTTEKRPPIGIGFLISVLRNAGHKVFFIDNYLQPSNFLEMDYLSKNSIDYVGIYANTICYRDTLRMLYKIEWLRQAGKWKGKIIVGGPHTTVCLDTIPDFVDFIVQGEGEYAILDIISGKTTDKIVKYPRIANLDELPMPAWNYFANLPYTWGGTFFSSEPVFTMNTSRGCPMSCEFCSVGSIWGREYTYFSAERIVSDIEYLIKNYGAKGIYFREDNFTLNKERLNKFCNLMIEKKLNIPWACESRVSSIDAENIALMHKAGVCGFYFGVESGSQRVLDFLKKGIKISQTVAAFNLCQKFGIRSAASVIVGVPTETEEEIEQTLALLKEIKPTVIWYNVFTGIPNSNLYKYTIENNLYKFIDDRGLVYMPDHDKLTNRFYGGVWDSEIPAYTPKISVVMSVYNGGRYLKEAIQSVLNQTYQDFEFIVINDKSTDKTSEIISSFDSPRIKVINNPENMGLTKSLNIGIKAAEGEYIARMDADDISLPHRFETQMKFLEEKPDYALVGSSFYQINDAGKTLSWTRVPTDYTEISSILKIHNTMGHGSVMMRKSSLIKSGGYNEDFEFAQDYDLWIRMSALFKIANIEEPLYCWRYTAGCISAAKKEEQKHYAQEAISRIGIRDIPVSVVMPTYNRPEMLKEALNSVLTQTHRNLDVIVVNDAGMDVKNIIAEFNEDNTITYIQHTENKGLAATRNTGTKAATGKYITYLDDDDIFYPNHLETLVYFLENSRYKVAYTDAIRVDQVLEEDGNYRNEIGDVYMSIDFSREFLLHDNLAPVHCFMHEKSCADSGIKFDESLHTHEDYDFWMRLSRHYDFKHIKKGTVEYRHRKEGFTQLSQSPFFVQTRETILNKCKEERLLYDKTITKVSPKKKEIQKPVTKVPTPKKEIQKPVTRTAVVLRGRDVYNYLVKNKKHTLFKGKPVVMCATDVELFRRKRDDNGKLLFEITQIPIGEI